jgi:hypothetical protein
MSVNINFNSQPFDPEKFGDVLREQIIEKAKENVFREISSTLSAEEQSQLTINVYEKDGNPVINLSGPEDIVKKAKDAIVIS